MPKPSFNPNKPFQSGEKPSFDPNKPHQALPEQQDTQPPVEAKPEQDTPTSSLNNKVMRPIASFIQGASRKAALGYGSDIDPKLAQEQPTADKAGEVAGDITVNTGIGSLLGKMTAGMGGLARMAAATAGYGAKGAIQKPDGPDTLQNRLQGAKEGAMGGAIAQGAGEALNALPGALRVGARSIVPGSAEKYTDSMESLIKGQRGVYQGQEMPAEAIWKAAGDTTNNTDRAIANSSLKKISPEIRDLIESKANELTGHGVHNAVMGPSAALAVLKGNVTPLALAPAAGALTGGGLEAARQFAKPAATLNSPKVASTLEALLEALKSKKKE